MATCQAVHYDGTPWCTAVALPDDKYCAEHREFINGRGHSRRNTRDWNKLFRELQLNGNEWVYAGAYRPNDSTYGRQHGFTFKVEDGEYGGKICYVKRAH